MKTWRIAGLFAAAFVMATATGCPKPEGSDTGTPDAGGGTDSTVPGTDGDLPGTDASEPPCPGGMMDIDVSADITADTTWSACNTYTLTTHIFVTTGATLTIEAGTTILGDLGSSLVVSTTGRIEAVGTAAAPIVFTSSAAVGSRAAGDWGGVLLLGLAPINVAGGTENIEGFAPGTGNINYGGTDAAHDCGTMNYVRIEFAGFELAPGNELNSLSVGGCGTGTDLDFIQTHMGADDGVEFFGGGVNASHILITQPDDDGLDWDFGWIGSVQFLIVQQNGLVGNNGFESDNNESDNDALPRSHPIIYNVTIIGSDADPATAPTQNGMTLRRGTAGDMFNVIVAHTTDMPVDIDDDATLVQSMTGELFIRNSIFFDNAGKAPWDDAESGTNLPIAEGVVFMAELTNMFGTDPMLTDALSLTAPNFTPMAGSPALTAANAATPTGAFFDATATYIGAIGTTDWTAGWTAFPAN